MTYPISDVTRRVVYSGSAGVGPYSFSFEIIDEGDIGVYFNSTELTLTTDYTVTINADGTGSITIVTGTNVPATPDSDDTISIFGNKGIQRQTDFVTGGDLFANTLNDEFDAQTIFAQQNSEAILRSLRAPVTDPTTIDMRLPLKADRAGRVLGFNDTTGNPEVGPLMSKVETLAAVSDDIALLADLQDGTTALDVLSDLADIKDDLDAVGGISSDIQTLATIAADIQTLADIEDGTDATDAIQTVVGLSDDMTAILAISDDITTVADNVTDVTNFADVYIGPSASDPITRTDGSALQAGDLYFNTGSNVLKTYTGSIWVTSGGISDIVEDTTPQLGGDLDTNGNDILFADNDKAIFGTGSDMRIYHDGVSSNIIDAANDSLSLRVGGTEKINVGTNVNVYSDIYLDSSNKININDNLEIYDVAGTEYIRATNAAQGSLHINVGKDFSVIHDVNTVLSYSESYGSVTLSPGGSERLTVRIATTQVFNSFTAKSDATFEDTVDFESTVYVGSGSIEATAAMEVESTTKGFLPPRMTDTQRDAITSPATGLMIYNTTTNKVNFYNGSAWRAIDDSAV